MERADASRRRARRLRGCFALTVGAALISCGWAASDPGLSESIDRIFAQWDTPASPGCSIAVSKQGTTIYERGYGMANLEYAAHNTPDTIFHVASISKQFTAAAVLLLSLDGRLSLDDPARRYVPRLPDFGPPITIRQLIHHTSGLRDQWSMLNLAGWRYSRDLITDEDVMGLVSRQRELNFPPGSRFDYSNTNYTVLAQIVREVSGKSLREFAAERLFVPLGMRDTHFRDDFAEIVPGIAYGYEKKDGVLKTGVTNFDTVGATSLLTTARDLLKWQHNFADGRVGGKALIEQMLELGTLSDGSRTDYAAGLFRGRHRGLATIHHGGWDAGYLSQLLRFPDQDVNIACLCNLFPMDPVGLAYQVADIVLAGDLAAIKDSTHPTPGRRTGVRPESRQGRTTGLHSDRETRRMPYEPGAAQLPAYVGRYWSNEIEIPYHVTLEEGRLRVRALKLPVQTLAPVEADAFNGEGLNFRFMRDARGDVTGFLMSDGSPAAYRFSRSPE